MKLFVAVLLAGSIAYAQGRFGQCNSSNATKFVAEAFEGVPNMAPSAAAKILNIRDHSAYKDVIVWYGISETKCVEFGVIMDEVGAIIPLREGLRLRLGLPASQGMRFAEKILHDRKMAIEILTMHGAFRKAFPNIRTRRHEYVHEIQSIRIEFDQ